jgi:cell division protein FtsN
LPRCAASDVTPGGAAPVGKPAPVPTAAPKAKFTLQIAAFKTRAQADALVKRLKALNLDDVRVVGTANPYRVRVGRYVTRAGAVAAQRQLKQKKIDAIVTDAEPEAK